MFDAAKAAQSIVETGGVTVSTFTGESPDSGYAVSLPGHEVRIQYAALRMPDTPGAWGNSALVRGWVATYARDHAVALAQPGHYLGAWISNDTLYLDVTTVIAERSDAIAAGHARAQLAIFNLGTGEEITLARVA